MAQSPEEELEEVLHCMTTNLMLAQMTVPIPILIPPLHPSPFPSHPHPHPSPHPANHLHPYQMVLATYSIVRATLNSEEVNLECVSR